MRLHGYFRSTASWRVRIALNVKGVASEYVFHHLRRGAQHLPEYVRLNPQGLVPTLETDDDGIITQSLAICEWLDETVPEPPLLPGNALMRAQIRAFALAIACDIHPVQNLKVLTRLRSFSLPEDKVTEWAAWIIRDGLVACEKLLQGQKGPFCFGEIPTLADVCLVPQLYNARRFGTDLSGLKRVLAAEEVCLALPAFANASPERQGDAE
jgi:maleylpyruvate isomerase